MIHPNTELRFICEEIGWGVVATTFIPKGTITWVRDDLDQIFSPQEAGRMSRACRDVMEKYSFMDGRGRLILCWDHARFVNHSCGANCLSPGYEFEIAIRDIEAGEELTDDYATLNLTEPFQCLCGLPSCRKLVRPDDPKRMADEWDAAVQGAFGWLGQVTQPLWPLVREKEDVERVLASQAPPASCRGNFRCLKETRRRPIMVAAGGNGNGNGHSELAAVPVRRAARLASGGR